MSGTSSLGLERMSEEVPDIVLLDLVMPEMDGFETVRRMREDPDLRDVKAIAVSASVASAIRDECLRVGFNDFIPKPVDASRVYDCLARLLHVKYKYDAGVSSIDTSGIDLSSSLVSRLREAAEFGLVTELEEALEGVRQLGERERLLADELLRLSRNFDVAGILKLLGDMESG